MDLGLEGQVAIVTGGSRGIGHACAASLLAEGAIVALVSRDADRLEATRQALAEVDRRQGDRSADRAAQR